MNLEAIKAQLQDGTSRSLPRLATLVENENRQAQEMLDALFPSTGNAHVVGVTGPPGVGKSTLIGALIPSIRKSGRKVAVVAIDPTSPFSGGAVLGDRIRMVKSHADPGVFVRSMASRGRLGGLAWTSAELVNLLDAAGFPIVIVETVGVGQDGIDIVQLADTVVVVEAPGLGDAVQAVKSGLLEVADIVVVNKADQPGSDDALRLLRSSLAMEGAAAWEVPVLGTDSTSGAGLPELLQAIDRHNAILKQTGELELRRHRQAAATVLSGVRRELERRVSNDAVPGGEVAQLVADVASRVLTPRRAVERISAQLSGGPA